MLIQEFKEELKGQLKTAWPIALTQLAQYALIVVSLAFCGHMSNEILDGASLAATLINVTGTSVILGLATACDTLFSQTYGSDNKFLVGTILQRSLLILMLCCLPCCALLLNTESLLLIVGQNANVARFAGEFTTWYIMFGGLPAQAVGIILSKYLQSMSIVFPSLIVYLLSNIFNAGLNMLLFTLDCGIIRYFLASFEPIIDIIYCAAQIAIILSQILDLTTIEDEGASVTVAATQWTVVALHLAYIMRSKIYITTWSGWNRHCLYDWWTVISLAVPGLFMICLEWWCFEIIVFVIGHLGVIPLASYTIINNVATLNFMAPFGLAIAASIRIGNHLGENSPSKASTASKVSIFLGVSFSLLSSTVIFSCKDVLPLVFTHDKEISSLSSTLLKYLALLVIFDSTQATISGVLRGTGNQMFGALINLIAFYLINLPITIPLVLKTSIGVEGAFVGMTLGAATQTVLFLIKIFTTNWHLESEKAQSRTEVNEITSMLSTYRGYTYAKMESPPDVNSNSALTDVSDILGTSTGTKTKYREELRYVIVSRVAVTFAFVIVLIGGVLLKVFLKKAFLKGGSACIRNEINGTLNSNYTFNAY